MKKYFSLIKACMSEGMNVFKVNTKKKSTMTKKLLPIFLTLMIMGLMASYSVTIIEVLQPVHMEFVLLTLFIILTSVLSLIEGVYKSGNLIFNCRDDNLLLSLPISKSTVLFIRVFKFYVFELLYNSLFLLPSMIVYAVYVKPDILYYIVSIIGLLVFPIVPILVSCILGSIVSFVASKFKGKNIVQTVLTIVLVLFLLKFSFYSDSLIKDLAKNATNINGFITRLYFPAGLYIGLVTEFNIIKFLEFIFIHLVLFIITIIIMGKIYFNINSSIKSVRTRKTKKDYKIKTLSPVKALIKKEFSRFINSPVFVINAGFGLVLFLIGCIMFSVKFESVANSVFENDPTFSIDVIKEYLPIIMFGFICCTSFMTSITSSMISLEGKTFGILKSLPIKPYTIVNAKVLTTMLIILPCMFVGDIVVFIRFGFDLVSVLILLCASVILPLVAETMGIIINLKYPRMDAQNDTEVVKQSMSSSVSVLVGMVIIGITAFLLFRAVFSDISNNLIILVFTLAFTFIYILLLTYLKKTCDKSFDNINV